MEMFNKFYEDWKKDYDDMTKSLLYKLGEKYKEFWTELMRDLQKKKIILEGEIEILENKFTNRNQEVKVLTEEMMQLRAGTKKERISLDSLCKKQKELAEQCVEYEKREAKVKQAEIDISKIKDEQEERELTIKAKLLDLQERERSVKRIYEKLNK